jgi:hypothetical protein
MDRTISPAGKKKTPTSAVGNNFLRVSQWLFPCFDISPGARGPILRNFLRIFTLLAAHDSSSIQ